MATIEREAVRAEIQIGSTTVSTPDIMSFNVSRSRGQAAATFNASVKVPYTMVEAGHFVAESIRIRAGASGRLNTIFTGTIYKCVVNPLRTDASKVILNISGKDVLGVLEGQKTNRRLKTYADGTGPIERWGVVNNVTKHNTPQQQRFKNKVYKPDPMVTVGHVNGQGIETRSMYVFQNENRLKDMAKRAAQSMQALEGTFNPKKTAEESSNTTTP